MQKNLNLSLEIQFKFYLLKETINFISGFFLDLSLVLFQFDFSYYTLKVLLLLPNRDRRCDRCQK
jgi:hypothetical protein